MPTGRIATRNKPVLSIRKTVLTCNRPLMELLKPMGYVRIAIEDGHPVVYSDSGGWSVTTDTNGHTGFIAAPALVAAVKAQLPEGTQWEMLPVLSGRCLRGELFQVETPGAIRYEVVPADELAELRRELAELRSRLTAASD